MAYRILLVDDDSDNLRDNRRFLASAGYTVVTATSASEAIEIFSRSKTDFAVILMDHHMPGMSGAEAVKEIKSIEPSQQIVMFSMDDTRDVMRMGFQAGAVDFLDKNIENQAFLAAIRGYCDKYEKVYRTIRPCNIPVDERSRLISETGMIGRSEQLFDLCKQIHRIAPSNASVLILGESGTGKELVARAIHNSSGRSKNPFVAVNIAAESATLLDSILFGHKRGAFTGALNDHPGKFQQADGGTLFLDEIGDMSLDLQVKLLRALQEKKVSPLGAVKDVPVDVRIVAATHKDLDKLRREGKFRDDLYFRIETMIVRTTPLRDRPEDIEPLVAQFTSEICAQNGFRKTFNSRCLNILIQQPWRGNVRELRSVVERHLVDSEVREIGPEHLAPNLNRGKATDKPQTMEEIDQHVEDVKRELIRQTLETSASKAEAARKLKVAPNRLHYFLERLGLRDVI